MSTDQMACLDSPTPVVTTDQLFEFNVNEIIFPSQDQATYRSDMQCMNFSPHTTSSLNKISINDQCWINNSRHDCSSWFIAKLKSKFGTNVINSGTWKIRISGSNFSKLFLSIKDDNNFTYWIDSLEIFILNGNNQIPIGVLYGNESPQIPSFSLEKTIMFDSAINITSLAVKYSRKCLKEGTPQRQLPFDGSEFSNYILETMEFQKL
jgi:hypothetical protein